VKSIDGTRTAGLELRARLKALESILPGCVLILDRFVGGFEYQFETQEGRSSLRIHRRPTRLVDDGTGHLQSSRFASCAKREAVRWHRRNPIETFRRDRRMAIMNLVRGDRRSLEYCKSRVRKNRLMRSTSRPIFPRHVAVVGGWCAPGESVALVVCSHAVKANAARQLPFEMIDAGEFNIGRGWLVVITVFVEPRNRVRADAAIGWFVILRDRWGTAPLFGLRIQRGTWQPSSRSGNCR